MAEWFNAAVLKTAVGKTHRGFESLPLRHSAMSKFYLTLAIWIVVVAVVFGVVWKQGYLARISTYVGETRDELKKCAWPTQNELWQSTLLILTTIAIMGLFTVVVDFAILRFVKLINMPF